MTEHRWDVTPEEAQRVQRELRERVVVADEFGPLRLIAGVDKRVDNQTAGRHTLHGR